MFGYDDIGRSIVRPAMLLDRCRGLETKLLRPGEPTPITLSVPAAISNGTQAVKLCSYKILQFLTGGAG